MYFKRMLGCFTLIFSYCFCANSRSLQNANIPSFYSDAQHTIHFCVTRNLTNGALDRDLLTQLKTAFRIEAFFETGTWLGDTTAEAALVFDEVHTVELSLEICNKAREKLRAYSNVSVYQGDSGKVLYDLLPLVPKRTLFYLDGHYSGGITAIGETGTPIINELAAIQSSGKSDSVILIDDIRLFQKSIYPEKTIQFSLQDYPDLSDLIGALLKINPAYQICFLGDALLAFPEDASVTVSPLTRACTIHRLSSIYNDFDDSTLEEADSVVSSISGVEKEEMMAYYQIYAPFEMEYGYRSFGAFWWGLILRAQGQEEQALELFQKAAQNSQIDWRIERLL